MGDCSWSVFVRSVKLVITFVFSHVGLCALVAGYAVAGAFIFRQLEQKHVEKHYDPFDRRNACVYEIFNITERAMGMVNLTKWREEFPRSMWQEEIMHYLAKVEDDIVSAVKKQLYDQGPDEQRERWSIIGSLFYCVTVITTIGYGHVSPRTWEGKLMTILYAIIGIPLMLLCLSNIGNSMATCFRFLYRRVCCIWCRKKRSEEEEAANSSNALQNPRLEGQGTQTNESGTAEDAEPLPYTPPPEYKPSRRNMLISPPISATIHKGSDDPLKLASSTPEPRKTPSKSPSPRLPKISHPQINVTDVEANRIVAECAAYTNTSIPGLFIAPIEKPQNNCHDYDTLTVMRHLSPPSTRKSPELSSPVSPVASDAPDVWAMRGMNGGPHIAIEAQFEQSPSSSSTRPTSPALTSSNHHASSSSSAVSSNVSHPWTQQGGFSPSVSFIPCGHDMDDVPRPRRKDKSSSPLGKTLVVYNTLSGDALLEQSRIVRRMALMNKGGFGIRREATTLFTDPVSGQAVNGCMLGLNYRPIPPDTSDEDNRVPIPIVIAFVFSYLGIGALLFGWLEGWSLLNSAYFCFITLSTIGFGDFVPGKSLGFETQEAQIKLVTGSLYLLFGLAVLAMSFNLVQEEVVLKCKAVALWIGLMKE